MFTANIFNSIAESILWKNSHEDWRKRWAETMGFSAAEMITQVAMIEGGYSLMRQVSPLVKEICWSGAEVDNPPAKV